MHPSYSGDKFPAYLSQLLHEMYRVQSTIITHIG